MPKAFTDITAKFMRMGESKKEAEGRAARIFNSKIAPKTGQAPMGPNWEERNAALQRKKGGKR